MKRMKASGRRTDRMKNEQEYEEECRINIEEKKEREGFTLSLGRSMKVDATTCEYICNYPSEYE